MTKIIAACALALLVSACWAAPREAPGADKLWLLVK